MRIRTALSWLAAALVAVACLVFAALFWVAREGAKTTEAQRASQEVARNIASLLNLTQEYTMLGAGRPAQQWHARHRQLMSTLDRVVLSDGGSSPELPKLRSQAQELAQLFAKLESVGQAAADPQSSDRKLLLQERLLVETQELVELRYAWAQQVIAADAQQQAMLNHLVVAGLAAILLCTGVAGWVVVKQVLVPLRALEEATHLLGTAATADRPAMTASNELGEAGLAVYAMADRLVEVQQQLRLIIDNVPALISQLDPAGKYLLANRAYLDWDTRGLNDLVGHTMLEVHGPEGHALLKPLFDQALAGVAASGEVQLSQGGSAHAMKVTYVPKLDEQGRVVAVYGLKADVTDVRRAEMQLRLMMDASPLGIFIRGLDGSFVFANPACRNLVGLTDAEARSGQRAQVIHPDDLPRVAGAFADAVAGHVCPPVEARVVHRDGTVRWARAHLRMFEHFGAKASVLGLVEDVTERRQLDALLAERTEALERSNEDLERFAYVASHDLQEPLRMVNSYGQLLLRRHGAELSDEAKEFLAFMVDGGQRAQALVRDLLSLARLDSQAKPFIPVSLESVLQASLHSLRDVVKRTQAQVTHTELPTVMGDPGQLGQLLTNLLSNAMKFSGPNPPQVHLSARRADATWEISVRDHGIGIDPKFFERIFVMFQRLHLRTEHPGTGIGLAICKRVVQRHGGRIWVQSSPGEGAEFIFTLADSVGKPPRATAGAEAHTDAQKG